MTDSSPFVTNATDATFESDVFVRSQLGLVVVDFWAEWCAPCRMLGPVLEKVATDFDGRFTLVKANTEETQQAASQFGVSGIPAVFAVLDGEIIDGFQGVMPEDQIKAWVIKCLNAADVVEAQRLVDEDPAAAEEKLRAVVAETPADSAAWISLAGVLLNQDRDAECREIIEELERRGFLESDAERLKATLDLKQKGMVDVDAARAHAEANPEDFELQLNLAEALAGRQQYIEAFEICLTLVANDRKQTGEKARELMVEVFRVLPDDSELTSEYRRKLSMVLY